MNHIKGAAPIVSPLVSAENWLIKGKKKMTLFTLAGALISAGYVCCVALATSAALHNRFFEGFLQNKKRDRARGQQQQKEREKRMDKFIHVQRSCSKTHTNGYDCRAFLSTSRLPSGCRLFSL